jgi:Flp pilus assembly protein TadG
MFRPHRSDRSTRGLVRLRHLIATRRHGQDPESGQAMTEFALILIPLLILVVGIIQFGIGLSYWLDMNRIANQGARWAVVDGWPGCPRTQTSPACNQAPACTAAQANTTLANHLRCEALTAGLQSNVFPTICFVDDPADPAVPGSVGTPVRVQLDSPFTFRAIMKLGTLNLRARATMRIENTLPGNHLAGTQPCPP